MLVASPLELGLVDDVVFRLPLVFSLVVLVLEESGKLLDADAPALLLAPG